MNPHDDLLTPDQLATVARVRRVCTLAGITGALASMAANMLASNGTTVGLAVGVIAPGAFILASEIASTASSLPRTRGARPLLTTLVGLLVVIGVSAAVVSFGHLREVVASVGESPAAEVLVAIVVDAVAVMGLIGHRLTGQYLHRHHSATEAKRRADQEAAAEARADAERREAAKAERTKRQADRFIERTERIRAGTGHVAGDDPTLPAPERARAIAAANPEMTQADIGDVIGRKERTVRRYLANTEPEPETPAPAEVANDDTTNEGRTPGLVAV